MAVTALPQPEEPDRTIVIDVNTITLGELEQLEDITGRNVVTELGRGQPSARTLTALIYVVKRRENPDFTLEDARAVNASEFRVEAQSSPKEPAG